MNPSISVIVPIYNVESYIGKCLRSLLDQSFTDFEALLIDDGSPDGSIEIARQIVGDDPRFTIYHKSNGGLSDARNYGIERARGEYIAFIDSDDYVHPDYLKVLYRACVDTGAEMSCCQYLFSLRDGRVLLPWPFPARKRVVSREKGIRMLIRDLSLQNMAWNKLYRRTLFTDTGVRYPDMCFEDIATSERLLYEADKLAITGKTLYYYTMRSGSIMHSRSEKLANDYLRALLIVCHHLRRKGQYNAFKAQIRFTAGKMFWVDARDIFLLHFRSRNLVGMGANFRRLRKNLRYILTPSADLSVELPELPYPIVAPEKRKEKLPAADY